MQRLIQSILKDFNLLLRDKVGLLLMFLMPIVLVLVITSLQNNTFKLVNDHQISLVLFDQDHGDMSQAFIEALDETGMFTMYIDSNRVDSASLAKTITQYDALVGVVLSPNFSIKIEEQAAAMTRLAMGIEDSSQISDDSTQFEELKIYYSPVLQNSYQMAIEGSLMGALKLVQSRKLLNMIYKSLNNETLPDELASSLLEGKMEVEKRVITEDGTGRIPNASQHNVPAWTLFAMFFMVVSLGSSLVKEKRNGSFVRLKTIPGAYIFHILSKQFVYVVASLIQVLVIFALGVLLFPQLGLPPLAMPSSITALLLVSITSGLCAVSYALAIGVWAETEEQANGFGAVSIVIFAALGGILVPAFAMPEAFQSFTGISPLFWCLQGFYELFLNDSGFPQILQSLMPIAIFIVILQTVSFFGMKRKDLF